MTSISASRDIDSTTDKVWDVISDTDRDPEYWYGTRSVKNIKKEGNVIERETVIAFKESKCREIVTLHDKDQIATEIIDGPVVGKKIVTLEKIDENKSRINVKWDIHMKGYMALFSFFVKKHILKGTQEALVRIANKAMEKQNN
jgi:ribosome-associated toxin RatA of RatAB toxin-antitoxin module